MEFVMYSYRVGLLLTLCTILVLAACGAPNAASPESSTSGSTAPSSAVTASDPATATTISSASYPVTIENCGRTLTFTQPPQRALAYYSYLADTLLKLGVGDAISALMVEYTPYTSPPDIAEAYQQLNVLVRDGDVPSRETTLNLQPDFAYVAFPEYSLDGASGFATLQELEAAGAQVYIPGGQCPGATYADYTVETVYTDILNLGKIFGVEADAQAIVEEMRSRIAAVQQRIADREPVRVAYCGEELGQVPVYVWARGLQSDIIRLAGGQNVYDRGDVDYIQISAEEFASNDVDAFLVSNEEVGKFLITTFPNLTASQNNHAIIVPNYRDGVRLADGVEELARVLHPEAFR
jgi:iron complex transport system substrate-binding protein